MENTWKFEDLSIVILGEAGSWVAQCLEFDVAAQGASVREAIKAWEHAFMAQAMANIEVGKQPMQDVPRAPSFYVQKFNEALPIDAPVDVIGPQSDNLDIPAAWMIHAMTDNLRISA